jgi:hypothetical protein
MAFCPDPVQSGRPRCNCAGWQQGRTTRMSMLDMMMVGGVVLLIILIVARKKR